MNGGRLHVRPRPPWDDGRRLPTPHDVWRVPARSALGRPTSSRPRAVRELGARAAGRSQTPNRSSNRAREAGGVTTTTTRTLRRGFAVRRRRKVALRNRRGEPTGRPCGWSPVAPLRSASFVYSFLWYQRNVQLGSVVLRCRDWHTKCRSMNVWVSVGGGGASGRPWRKVPPGDVGYTSTRW